MIQRGTQQGIPGGLAVHMGMGIHPTRDHQQTTGINFAGAIPAYVAEGNNHAVAHGDIDCLRRGTRAIDHFAIANYQIVHSHIPGLEKGAYRLAQRGYFSTYSPNGR